MSSFLRFQRDYERSEINETVNQKAVSERGKHTIGAQVRSRSSQNLRLGSLNRYSSLLKQRERYAPFTLNSALGQIAEEKDTLKKKLMKMSKTFKVTPHSAGKDNPDPVDIQLLRGRSVSLSIEEEQKMPPLDEVSDSLSISQDADENYRLPSPEYNQVNVINSQRPNIKALQGK